MGFGSDSGDTPKGKGFGGTSPISQKKTAKKPSKGKKSLSNMAYDDVYGNLLNVSPEMKKELQDKGLAYKFINARQHKENFGYHRSGWKPYKFESDVGGSDVFGGTGDGYVRRGDLVLAVQPSQAVEHRKAYIQQRTDRQAQIQSQTAAELRKMAKANNIDMVVDDGFGDDDEDGFSS